MPFRAKSDSRGADLVKTQVAMALRERILRGELQPGQIISETQWAPVLRTAQASVREALNQLISEGLVRKEPGRSARVTSLTHRDVVHAYQVRIVMEGLAARLAAEQRLSVSALETSIDDMKNAAAQGDVRRAIEADLMFHLQLSELPGNPFLAQSLRQLLIPLFAFTLIRALRNNEAASAWVAAADDHHVILTGIRSGDPAFAEHSARHAIGKFAGIANEVWAWEDGATAPKTAGGGRSR